MEQRIYEGLCALAGQDRVRTDEPMKLHTTFRIGGPADYFVMPDSEETITALLTFCREEHLPWFLIGNGSNLLVSDAGYRGVILQLYKNFQSFTVTGDTITAQAGVSLARLAQAAAREELTGLEFASGIPGTLGGACIMNAGAYGGEMKDVLTRVRVLDQTGQLLTLELPEMELAYRSSRMKREGLLILGAELSLKRGSGAEIQARMEELRKSRTEKQPLEYPSAGSTFKRPEGYFAGKLIQDAGLRGFRVGDAQVSEKHCGFVVNRGAATARDVRELMRRVQEKVAAQFQVELEPEVLFLGEFD